MEPDLIEIDEMPTGELSLSSSGRVPWGWVCTVLIAAIIAGIILGPHSRLHTWWFKRKVYAQDAQLVSEANYLDAEAVTGQAIPTDLVLADVKSFDGIHTLSFLDLKAGELISVLLSDSEANLSAQEMYAAWNSYAKRVVAGLRGDPSKIRDFDPIKVVGQKILKLRSGEIVSEKILVPLLEGGTTEGMQVRITKEGKTLNIVAYGSKYGKQFSETAFIRFLNSWQTATQLWSSTLSPDQKSRAYTKRGEWLRKYKVRWPEAQADFQKALQLDANNSEARLQLQSLMNVPAPKE